MRVTSLGLVLLLTACATTPDSELGDLYVEHARCIATEGQHCNELWMEIERREQVAMRREDASPCPRGTVSLSNNAGPQACVSHAKAQAVLRRALHQR